MAIPAGAGEVVQIQSQLRKRIDGFLVMNLCGDDRTVLAQPQLAEIMVSLQRQLPETSPGWPVVKSLLFQAGFSVSFHHALFSLIMVLFLR